MVRRLGDLSPVELDAPGWIVPRWDPARPASIVHVDASDAELAVRRTDVASGRTTTAFTFPARYRRLRTDQSFDELSRDGRWMAGMLAREDGAGVIFALDLERGALGVELALPELYATDCRPDPEWGEVEPDWIGVSPLGTYLVVQWRRDGTERCSGLETFDPRTGAFRGRVTDGHQHGDLGVLPDGVTEVFTTFELYHPSGALAIGRRELFLLDDVGRIRRLAHHRSSSCGYWVQPRATVSRDGRFVAFASDWAQGTGADSCTTGDALGRGDAYVIDLGAQGP